MKTATSLFLGLLAASSVMAAPHTAKRAARHARRAANAHRGQPMIPSNATAPTMSPEGIMTEYSTNWAGAALESSGFTSVTGKFTVPSVSKPSGGSSSTSYSSSAWVGIDGFTCETAILQTGVDFSVQDGEDSYDAWYEWYPNYAYDFSDMTVSKGDVIKVTVTATSKKAGSATIDNETTGKSVTHKFSSETDSLCETNAEWIVEDYEEGDSLVALADFGTITFTDATALKDGSTVGPSGATLIDMETSSGTVEATTSTGTDEVTVKYVK